VGFECPLLANKLVKSRGVTFWCVESLLVEDVCGTWILFCYGCRRTEAGALRDGETELLRRTGQRTRDLGDRDVECSAFAMLRYDLETLLNQTSPESERYDLRGARQATSAWHRRPAEHVGRRTSSELELGTKILGFDRVNTGWRLSHRYPTLRRTKPLRLAPTIYG
jgi:hypothetical protein